MSHNSTYPAWVTDPIRDQRALREDGAWCALNLGCVQITGADAWTLLTTLSSQICQPDGHPHEALFLNHQGHIVFATTIIAGPAPSRDVAPDNGAQSALCIINRDHMDDFAQFLHDRRFMMDVTATPQPTWPIYGTWQTGQQALTHTVQNVLEHAEISRDHLVTWHDPWPGITPGGTTYFMDDTAHPGDDYAAAYVCVAATPTEELTAALAELPQAGTLAWEALRIAAARPSIAECDERTIPHELDWLRTAVHLTKGCYPGQEVIARTINIGKPPRRLVLLDLDGFTAHTPASGSPVRMGERIVGHVTSVTRHCDWGPLALALIKRAVPADVPLTTHDADDPDIRIAAHQRPLVDPSGRAAASPQNRPGEELRARNRRKDLLP